MMTRTRANTVLFPTGSLHSSRVQVPEFIVSPSDPPADLDISTFSMCPSPDSSSTAVAFTLLPSLYFAPVAPAHVSENHTIQRGIFTQSVVVVNTFHDLSRNVQTGNCLKNRAQNSKILINVETSHAAVNDWCGKRVVVRLRCNFRSRNDVVAKFLS